MEPETGGRASPEHLVVGHIAKAHGTRGELFIWPLTDSPGDVFAPGRELLLGDEEGALDVEAPSVVVESVRPFKRGVLLKLEGHEGRDGAGELAGRYLLLPAGVLAPTDEDELFYHELLGMAVVTVAGEPVGNVREVYETEPHHMLEVVGDEGKPRLIPFARRIVTAIDRAGRRLVIDPPAGLLDL
ncbi:ribosome maturation factor RimM [soil metagenome]